jgi:hypothetical protein
MFLLHNIIQHSTEGHFKNKVLIFLSQNVLDLIPFPQNKQDFLDQGLILQSLIFTFFIFFKIFVPTSKWGIWTNMKDMI